jgi:hypothetical protein
MVGRDRRSLSNECNMMSGWTVLVLSTGRYESRVLT